MKKSLLIIALALATTACSQRVLDFTMISSKNVDLSRSADLQRAPMRVRGEDRKSIVIVFPLGKPDAKEAMDQAIESVPGAVALVDGVITEHAWYIPYIYGQQWYEVEGTPLIDTRLQAPRAQSR